jgi:hypothetical protein
MTSVDAPLALTARMVIVLEQLNAARTENNPTKEFGWLGLLDRLLDQHTVLLKANNRFRPLCDVDPELDARLSVKVGYKLVGASQRPT